MSTSGLIFARMGVCWGAGVWLIHPAHARVECSPDPTNGDLPRAGPIAHGSVFFSLRRSDHT